MQMSTRKKKNKMSVIASSSLNTTDCWQNPDYLKRERHGVKGGASEIWTKIERVT